MKTYSNAKRWKQGFLFLLTSLLFSVAYGQTSWPLTGERENVKVSVFKPVAESLKSNQLEFNAGIAIYQNNGNPVFGAIWGNAKTTISTSTAKLSSVKITDVRFPDGITDAQKTEIILLIENSFNNKNVELSLDGITNDLRNVENELLLSSQMDNTPPKIYFEKESSILVTIDGDPIVESTSTKGIDAVVNTPFLILKYQNSFYLSNGEQWYRASSATGKYNPEKSIPKAVTKMAESLKSKEEATAESKKDFYPKVIVSTVPAELIQTEGEPSFSAIQGTSLLFVSNTEEQLLFDIKSQNYYVLLSGRWFNSTALDGHWTYADPNHLPADFAKIPEGSDKDIVLANVPGTQAANEAIKDAQVPYTAAVERNTTATEVEYDGTPVFETIQGTNIQLATNSSSTVMLDNNTYYLVDNGIWFSSNSPYGPWVVSDQRPEHVNDIPPTSSAYNVKYVNIYHSTPEVVYVGYTSGYVSNYIAGPVIVYGTGYRYRPWRRVHYIPRPCTWGFGMYYNPWYGWSMNIAYGVGGYGWFGFYSPWHPPHWGHHRYMGCGWWGPPVYRPPYGTPYSHYYGHRGAVARPPRFGGGNVAMRSTTTRQVHNTNVYNYQRQGVVANRGNVNTVIRETPQQAGNLNYSNRARPETVSREKERTPTHNAQTNVRQPISSSTFGTNQNSNNRQSTTTPSTNQNSNNRQSTTTPSTNQNSNTRQPSATPSTNQNSNNRQSTTTPSTNQNSNNRQSTTTPSTNQNSNNRQSTTTPSTNQNNNNRQPSATPSTNQNSNTRQPSATPSTNQNSNTRQPSATPSTNQNSNTRQPSATPSTNQNSNNRQPSATPSTNQNSNTRQPSASTPTKSSSGSNKTIYQRPATRPTVTESKTSGASKSSTTTRQSTSTSKQSMPTRSSSSSRNSPSRSGSRR